MEKFENSVLLARLQLAFTEQICAPCLTNFQLVLLKPVFRRATKHIQFNYDRSARTRIWLVSYDDSPNGESASSKKSVAQNVGYVHNLLLFKITSEIALPKSVPTWCDIALIWVVYEIPFQSCLKYFVVTPSKNS